MKKLIFLFIILTATIMAGENVENNGLKDEFGIALGPGIGWGLSYRHTLDEKLSVRITGGYFHDNNTTYNLGVELNYSLKRNQYMDFFLSGGLLHTYEEHSYYYYGDDVYTEKSREYDTRGVIGIGFSSYIYDLLIISVQFQEIFEYDYRSSENTDTRKEFNIYPMIGYTIGFMF